MKHPLAFAALLLASACRAAPVADGAPGARLSEPSGLERVRLFAKGME